MKKVLGYTNVWSVTAGETINVMVSTYGVDRFRADLVRVICGDDEPSHGIYLEEHVEAPFSGEYPGREQPIDVGSYALVSSSPYLDVVESFTVQSWIWPTTPGRGEQGRITRWQDNPACGFALLIDDTGALALRSGDGNGNIAEVSTGIALAPRRWYLVSGSYDAANKVLHVSQQPNGSSLETHQHASETTTVEIGAIATADASLLFAALPAMLSTGRVASKCHFNGKMDAPRLSADVLSAAEVSALAHNARPDGDNPHLVGAWDFSRDIGTDTVSDVSLHGLQGRTVNLPSRGCKGYNWSAREHNWSHAPLEYGAIHFHDDDLYDAGWETDFDYQVPVDLHSGVYAVRLRAEDDEWYVTFFVRPPRGTTTAKLAFLASTATYMAYSNYQWTLHQRDS